MAKFSKKIVSTGVRKVGRLDGREETDAITPEKTRRWVENTKKLQKLGVKIPAPLSHQDKNRKLAFPVIEGKDGETLADAYSGLNNAIPASWDVANLNTGFWDSFEVEADGSIVGVLNADGEVDNANSHAGKIGKSVQETSILVMPERTVVDQSGQSHTIGEHIAHVAVCVHPQEPGQSNFQPMSGLDPSLAMSFIIMDEISGTGGGYSNTQSQPGMGQPGACPSMNPEDQEFQEVVGLLKSAKNLAIPDDTQPEEFIHVLKIVLTQSLAEQRNQEQEEGFNQRPQDSQVKSPSVAMSQTVQPEKPNTTEVILMNMLTGNKKKSLKARVDKLVETGRTSKAFADSNLYPKIEAFKMSAADVKEGQNEVHGGLIEELIMGLEQATPITGPSLLDQGMGMDYPDGAMEEERQADVITGDVPFGELSDAQMDAVLSGISL